MTIFGTAVTATPDAPTRKWEDVLGDHERECGPAGFLRSYDGGTPASWLSKSTATGAHIPTAPGWTRRASWHSMKPDAAALASGALDGWVRDYLDSIPVTGLERSLTIWHEPKAKIKSGLLDAATWKRAAYRFGRVVQDVGHPDVTYGPCFAAQWDLTGDVNLDTIMASDPCDLFSVCDFIGWDPYHEDSRYGRYGPQYTPAMYIDPLLQWGRDNAAGVPVRLGETGMVDNPADPDDRSRWIRALVDYCELNRIEVACYFDSDVGGPFHLRRKHDGTADVTAARTWGLCYP